MFTHGPRLGFGAPRVHGHVAERPVLSRSQSPHGLHPGGLRCRVRRARYGTGNYHRRQTTLERVTTFTIAEADIKQRASEEPGDGQMHTIRARKHHGATEAQSSRFDDTQLIRC